MVRTWDQDGEFTSRAGEHVPVCRLLDAVTTGLVTSCAVVAPSSGTTTNAAAGKRVGDAAAVGVAAAAATPAPPANEGCDGGDGAGDVPAVAASETDEAADLLQHIYALQVREQACFWGGEWEVGYCLSGAAACLGVRRCKYDGVTWLLLCEKTRCVLVFMAVVAARSARVDGRHYRRYQARGLLLSSLHVFLLSKSMLSCRC